MNNFSVFFEVGLRHVLDINGYDHILFLLVLTIPYTLKEWKKILLLVTVFTIGHTVSLFLAVFNIISVKAEITEFLILVTILLTAIYNLFIGSKSAKNTPISFVWITTLFFGIIHGLGFSNYFKSLIGGDTSDKLSILLSFATGIEAAQIIVVAFVLLISFLILTLSVFNKRETVLIASAFVVGILFPLLLEKFREGVL